MTLGPRVPLNLLQVVSVCSLLHAPAPRGTKRVCSHGHSPLGKKEEGKNVLLSIYECPAFPAARLKALTSFHLLSPISLSIDCSLPQGITGFKSFIF